MKTSILKIIILIFVIFFLSVFWRALKINNNYDTKNLVGSKISNFQLNDINSGAQYIPEKNLKKNKYTLINFFASWCAPCRQEHKYLLKLNNQNKNIKILGINFKDKKNNALIFLNELGNPYNSVLEDPDGRASVLFGIYGIPESILINKELTIIKKIIGPIDKKQFEEILNLTL